jgi:hypothetical protein
MMRPLARVLREITTRAVPALITALGVVLVTVGLLAYGDPATAGVLPTASPIGDVATPAPSSSADLPSVNPSAGPTESPGATVPPGTAVVTRVVVPALQIDLPVVAAPSGYPYCDVAMYFGPPMGQPGEGKATYLFAHARDGMFGPIFKLAMGPTGSGAGATPRKMLGMIVQAYTSDNKLYLYEVSKVLLHQLTLDAPYAATTEQLWLQTSEGPHGTPGKTQLVATLLSVGNADPADAHPKPHAVTCPGAPPA